MNQDQQDRMDPRLAAALAELRREGVPARDWERMRQEIVRRSEPHIARRRRRSHWFVPRPLLPLAAAASIAFALWMGPRLLLEQPGVELAEAVAESDADAALLEAMAADLSDQEFRLLVTGRADPDELLLVAVSDR